MSAQVFFKLDTKHSRHPPHINDPDRRPRAGAGLFRFLFLAGLLFGLATPVAADTLQISGTGLVRHCPCDVDAADNAIVTEGVLKPQATNTRYFAPVVFPRDGETVCRFTMVYRDVNAANTMTATLKRKIVHNNGPAFDPPIVMATLATAAGTPDTMRKASTTAIKSPGLRTDNSFYFIEVQVPTVNLEIVGFQIDVRAGGCAS